MSGVIFDSQSIIGQISGKGGIVVKAYADGELAKVNSTVLPYRIESNDGNLAGYFNLKITANSVYLFQIQLRPAFIDSSVQIVGQINDFIVKRGYQKDIL